MKVQDCVFLDIAIDLKMALNVRGASHETFSYGCNDLYTYSFSYLLTLNLCVLLPLNLEMGCPWGKVYLYFWVYRSKRYKSKHREEE